MPSRREVLTYVALLVASVAAAWTTGSSAAIGLDARFWRNVDWSGPPATIATGSLPETGHVLRHGPPPGVPSSAEWTGFFVAGRSGTFFFELASDDGAWLSVDGTLVVDNGGEHGRQVATGTIDLAAGPHQIRVRYFQSSGDLALEVYWSGPGTSRRMLRATDVTPSAAAARLGDWRPIARGAAVALVVLWAGLLLYLPARLVGGWMWREVRRVAPRAVERHALVSVLLLGFGLMIWGLDWGLDAFWAADELTPSQVRELLARRFADGWYDKYPVMHYAVLGIPVSAFTIADRVGLLAADSLASHMAQLAMMRVVSVVMGIGALVAAFLCAAELYGARRAVLGVLPLLLTGLFVYYGKVANLDVPFMCWFGLTMLGFIRVWKTNRMADYLLLGIGAAAAVATKDQAYASVALLPVGVVAANIARGSGAVPAASKLIVGGVVSAAAFAVFHNALFNAGGVVNHFRLLSTLGDLAIVPRGVDGYLQMTAITADLFRFVLGWPLLLFALAGIVNAARRPERRCWLWMLLVPLSFHLTFTFVTLYVNDRYLFGGVFVLALFAGSAMADLIDRPRHQGAALAAVCATLAYSLLLALSVNVMMNLDSRKTVRAWLARHAPEGARVGLIGAYGPSVGPAQRGVPLPPSIAQVRQRAPDYIVVNARFAGRYQLERAADGRDLLRALADGSLGYVEVLRHRAAIPWWAILQRDPEYRRDRESVLTNLDKINPEVVVYARR